MNRFLLLISFFFVFAGTLTAQVTDTTTIPVADSVVKMDTVIAKDTLIPAPGVDTFYMRPVAGLPWTMDSAISFSSPRFTAEALKHHPYFGFNTIPQTPVPSDKRTFRGKELLFYALVFLLIVFGFLKRAFPKYFSDLFRLFFRTTLKQRQIREQLVQTPLPSLLLNGFFVVSGGLYITFLLKHFQLDPVDNFWLLFIYCCIGLSAAYLIKFIGLKVSGWLFNMSEAADSYIFIVFVVNKMIGIFLIPFLVLLAFALGNIYSVGLTLSWCIVAGLLGYRFILTYAAIRNQVKVNPFHFFLYLLAFEIAPLLLVYKGLLFFFARTA